MSKPIAGRVSLLRSSFAALAVVVGCASPHTPVRLPAPGRAPASVASGPSLVVASPPCENHGGMWLPSQVPEHAAELKKLGLAIDPALLADPKSSVLGAIVNLNGCSASFVSKDGLVVTNHHCATGALQRNSTPAQDLLKTGMLARSQAEERTSGPAARLNVLSKVSEVTSQVVPALAKITDDLARELELERLEKDSVARCEQGRPGIRCGLVSMYAGLRYFMLETLEIRDVRIVYAPAASIGNFGGEIDNWRWPRQCGDVSFFRAYVGKDGMPADYSPSNVPYQPPAFLKLATTPLAEGDLVFVAGYPGHTSLLAPAVEMRQTESVIYPEQLAMFDAYLALFAALSNGDPELAIKATGRRRGFDNYRTKHLGELEGMKRGQLLAKKEAEDQALQAFITSDPNRTASYGTVIADIEQAFAERELTREADTALEREYLMPRLLWAAYRILRMADERQKPDAERDPEYQERNVARLRDELKALPASYNPKLDRAMLKLALQRDRARDSGHRTPALELMAGKDATDAAIDSALAKLYDKPRLADEKFRLGLFDTAHFKALGEHSDPIVRLVAKLYPQLLAVRDRRKRFDGKLLLLEPRYLEALLAFKGGALAPDANSTLRVAYGTVKRAPQGEPGANIGAFTSVAQVVAKTTGKEPFDTPQSLLSAAKDSTHSRYADRALGDVPVDFLSDLHITNGNSGSATLNARGELVGLAFDGTYESVASDWLFVPSTRSIHVDLRYILFLLQDVEHAQELLTELGAARQ
ncbi:MAG TPA: S46 family peptidase [Polyangiaceae bacterium]